VLWRLTMSPGNGVTGLACPRRRMMCQVARTLASVVRRARPTFTPGTFFARFSAKTKLDVVVFFVSFRGDDAAQCSGLVVCGVQARRFTP